MVLPTSKKNVAFCDLAACYGAGDLANLIKTRYDLAFSLWLNRKRSIVRQAETVRLGAVTALSNDMRLGWFMCQADDPGEARYHFDRHQAAKIQAESSSK